MGLRFSILASPSSGNCALLQSEGARVLIDAGFSGRRLKQMLHDAGTSFEAIDAVVLTHEHGDHAAGIEGLARFPHVQVFANAATARAVQAKAGRASYVRAEQLEGHVDPGAGAVALLFEKLAS